MEASDGGTAPPNLTPDVATTQPSVDTSNAVALVGYLGDGQSDEYRRLYQTLAMNRWIEMLAEDIVARAPADGGDDPTAGQSVVWVRRDATVFSCESVRASSYESPPSQDGEIPARIWPRP